VAEDTAKQEPAKKAQPDTQGARAASAPGAKSSEGSAKTNTQAAAPKGSGKASASVPTSKPAQTKKATATKAQDKTSTKAADRAPANEKGDTQKGGSPQPPAKAKGSSKFAWVLVFLLVFFIGGVIATPYILPPIAPMLPEPVRAYFAPLLGGGVVDPFGEAVQAKLNQVDAAVQDLNQLATRNQKAIQNLPSAETVSQAATVAAQLSGLASQVDQIGQAQAQQAETYARLQTALDSAPGSEGGEGGGISAVALANLKAQLADAQTARDDLAQTVASLSSQIGALADRQQSAAGAAEVSETTAALRARLSSLEARLNLVADAANGAAAPQALEAVSTAVTAALEGFEGRLAALESVRQQATAAMVAGLETARLAQAVGSGRAYAAELKALTQLKLQAGPAVPDIDDLLEQIKPFAETGIASGAALSAQLEARSREILTAIDTPEGADWWQRLLARVRNLVTVRKVGMGTDSAAPPDVLARAEEAARAGEWSRVVAEIETLPQAAKDSLGTWWAEAQARATAQRVLADLSARLGVVAADADIAPAAETGQAQ